jgi:hypothetical protein
MNKIACFVSPHGFGHAARACALMDAVHTISSDLTFEIFTTVPQWFFQDSLSRSFGYHSLLTDIGLMQETPLRANISMTLDRLNSFLPFKNAYLENLANKITALGCKLVICDIAPLGIAVAAKAKIPSLLVENFTWDWVYREYADQWPELNRHMDYLQSVFQSADYHIQTEPVCLHRPSELRVGPISRLPKAERQEILHRLKIPHSRKLVVITMGGIQGQYDFLKKLNAVKGVSFVAPGGADAESLQDNVIMLPQRSDFFHPDLIAASNAVVGKAGYSTLAEVCHAGVPFGYVKRPHFKESEILGAYMEAKGNAIPIHPEEFENGAWISKLNQLLSLPTLQKTASNDASTVAQFVSRIAHKKNPQISL